jgi:hypothetical protein
LNEYAQQRHLDQISIYCLARIDHTPEENPRSSDPGKISLKLNKEK